jgi:tetratricopeptide (TPR) repeat protein
MKYTNHHHHLFDNILCILHREEDNIFAPFSCNIEAGETGEFQETALAAYEQAIQLAPYEAILHYHRAQLLKQLGRLVEASSAYEEARRLGYQFS